MMQIRCGEEIFIVRIPPTSQQTKTVRFSTVLVREYPMILGDNPSVSSGPPITIDWKYFSESIWDIECHYLKTLDHRRSTREMKMTRIFREKLLKRIGFSTCDVKEAIAEAEEIKRRRLASSRSVNFIFMDIVKENMRRYMSKLLFRRKKVKKKNFETGEAHLHPDRFICPQILKVHLKVPIL